MDIKPGTTFKHPRVLIPGTREPHPYIVTRVARGLVYFKATEDGATIGGSGYTDAETFVKWLERQQ
jgi:hypothetical protein